MVRVRVTGVLAGIISDAQRDGDLEPAKIPPISVAMAAQAEPVAQAEIGRAHV